MVDKIEPIPEKTPEVLRIAAVQRKLIPFIGAGVSQLGGCPNWTEFADRALRFFVQEKKLNHAEFSQINVLSPRVKLSIALELEKKHEKEIDFKGILSPPEDKKKEIGEKLYANLSRLATTFVTTNYDDWLDQSPPASFYGNGQASSSNPPDIARQSFYKRKDITVKNLLDVSNAVFHIHGSIHDRDSMILTTVDYLDLYSSHRINGKDRENPFLTFLQTLFSLKNVLFIGYGLSELEILEYIIQKGLEKRPKTDESPRHYVLQGFFSHELGLAQNLEKYYYQFGIGLIPFRRDERNYEQLIEVIDHLAQKIPPGPTLTSPKLLEMEDLLS
ncbi:MAG: SIR2 family protein [Desulfobacteraceae bacterium]|nr:SIR2 family protein [Desulfobacteraceae bacterium]